MTLQPFPTSKRSACDRCRNQKLRCPPRENSNSPCARCLGAGAECVTGFSKALGRHANSVPVPVPGDAARKKRSPTIRRPSASDTPKTSDPVRPFWEGTPSIYGSQATQAQSLPRPIGLSSNVSELVLGQEQASWSWPNSDDNSHLLTNPLASPFSVPDDSSGVFGIGNPLQVSDTLPRDDQGPIHEDRAYGFAQVLDLRDTGCFTAPGSGTPNEPSLGSKLVGSESDPRLFKLGLDLAKQLQTALASRPDSWEPTVTDPSPSNVMLERPTDISTDLDLDLQWGSASFGSALRGTSEYIAILQSYYFSVGAASATSSPVRENIRDATGGAVGSNVSTGRPRLGTITTLNILSVYLQLVAIYDNLLLSILEQQNGADNAGSGHGLQTLPGLQLAGFLVQHGNLQTKILIQAVLHQFEAIEKMLGLQAEFRVSDRREAYTGLLEDEASQGLIRAVMVGVGPQCVNGKVGSPRTLLSLRDSIRRLRSSLDV